MKIAICGSMAFSKEMIRVQKELEKMGHDIKFPDDTEKAEERKLNTDLDADFRHCVATDIMKVWHNEIANSDAALVVNGTKHGIENYIGVATMMDLAVSYHENKKIFVLNGMPDRNKLRHTHELMIMNPIFMNGDLNNINKLRIVICGSSTFKHKMIEFREKLNKIGHRAIVNPIYDEFQEGKLQELWERIQHEHAEVKKEYNFVKWYFEQIKRADAILVLNFDKNDIKNYIGGNTLMEMGFAHAHDKKVFLLNPPPEIGYKDEILATMTKVINGDINNIE